jgi:hypothetical protein
MLQFYVLNIYKRVGTVPEIGIIMRDEQESRNMFEKYPNQWRTTRNVVANLDSVPATYRFCDNKQNSKYKMHFVFIGDSRIRQHFLNFLKVNY